MYKLRSPRTAKVHKIDVAKDSKRIFEEHRTMRRPQNRRSCPARGLIEKA